MLLTRICYRDSEAIARLRHSNCRLAKNFESQNNRIHATTNRAQKFNRVFNTDTVEFGEYELFHITSPESPRLLQLTTNFASVTTYDPISGTVSTGPFPNLMRRYKYVHQARMAGTVGILVNTLSLANTKVLLNTIKEKIKEAGKKHYIFVVGKPNVAKLANFESVDIWCILGCDHQEL